MSQPNTAIASGAREGQAAQARPGLPGRAVLNEVLWHKARDFWPFPGVGFAASCEKKRHSAGRSGGTGARGRQKASRTPGSPSRDSAASRGAGHTPGPSGCVLCGHHLGGPGRPGFLGLALKKAAGREPVISLAPRTGPQRLICNSTRAQKMETFS